VNDLDWKHIAPDIVLKLKGEPKSKTTEEWRYGSKGSFVFNVSSGTVYDFELGEGGGITWLIQQHGLEIDDVLKDFGIARPVLSAPQKEGGHIDMATRSSTDKDSHKKSVGTGLAFSREQMNNLYKEAIVKLKYAPNFWVMRFPEGHKIKMKYAPFTLIDDKWYMKRPEGLLPIYAEENHLDKPIIINEGEKAALGCKRFYQYDVCCWHGGAGSWSKSDWSKLYKREVLIYPDKDTPGIKAATEIQAYLRKHGCNVQIIKPHPKLLEKDDLYDAAEKEIFTDTEEFLDYAKDYPLRAARGSLEFLTVDQIVSSMKEPDWLIDSVIERGSVASIFGKPKSGKSFIAIAMACSIATGKDFYGKPSKTTTVAYIAGEGNVSISRRFVAYQQGFARDLSAAPLLISNRGARILDDDDYKHLLDVLRDMESTHGSIGAIVLDTLARTFGGGDENSTSDMNKYIQRIDAIKEEFNASIIIVHHTGHGVGTRSRGSSVLPAALDYEFKVVREDADDVMYVQMSQTLVKDGMAIDPLNFKFTEISPLLKMKNMRSGILEQTEELPKDKRLTKKREETIKAIENYQLEKDKNNPVNIWITPTVLAAYMDIKKNTLQTRLTDLRDADLIHYDKEKGAYQSKRWDSEVF
tara:strand:- start:205 stop:2118 length:1914 start_codon:yes stop_codon:yes gene_type:complete